MNSNIISHIIHINSKKRVLGSSNDFVINVKRPFTLLNAKNYFKIRVVQCNIPNTIQQVNETNNIINFKYFKKFLVF